MLHSLKIAGLENITLSLGHAGFTDAVLQPFKKLGKDLFSSIELALSKKSKTNPK